MHPDLDLLPCQTQSHPPQTSSAALSGDLSVQSETIRKLMSLSFMDPIIKTIERLSATDTEGELENEIFSALSDATHDPLSPWSRLLPKPLPIDGPRTPEQYLCAIDIALNARKEAKSRRKIAKYWKRLATQGNSSEETLLTPSPSDISDSGLCDLLPSPRKDRMKELMAKRQMVLPNLSDNTLYADEHLHTLPINASAVLFDEDSRWSSESNIIDSTSDTCDTPSLVQDCTMSIADGTEAPTVEWRTPSETRITSTSIPFLKKPTVSTSPISPDDAIKPYSADKDIYALQIPAKISKPGGTSVSSRRRVFESLASSSTPVRIPVSSTRPKPGSRIPSPTTRIFSPISSQIPPPLPIMHHRPVLNPRSTPSIGSRLPKTAQMKSTNLPQARRKLSK